ncbi:MAG: hypothetical protein ACLQU4_05100 [Limisphaerales bacterium]
MMKVELRSSAFAPKDFGAAARQAPFNEGDGAKRDASSRPPVKAFGDGGSPRDEGGSNPHQSGSHRVAASRSDFKKDSALIPTAHHRMFPFVPAFPEERDNTMKHENRILGHFPPVSTGTRCRPMGSNGSVLPLFRADSG